MLWNWVQLFSTHCMMSKLGINQLIKIQSTSWWCLFFANSNSAPKTRVLSTILALLVFVHQESINCAVTLFFVLRRDESNRRWYPENCLINCPAEARSVSSHPTARSRAFSRLLISSLLTSASALLLLSFTLSSLLYNLHFLQNCKVCNHKKGGTPALICWFSRTREHHCVNSFCSFFHFFY